MNFDCCGEVGPDDCIDLKKRFGRKYVIGWEDPYFQGTACPWHYVIRCKHGFIAPAGKDTLWACSGTRLGKQVLTDLVREYPDRFKVRMDGDDGINISLAVTDMADVALVLQVLRR